MKLISNRSEWIAYKCGHEYSDIGFQHEGEPAEFPCYVSTTSRDVNFNTCWVYYTHTFLYRRDLEKLLAGMTALNGLAAACSS